MHMANEGNQIAMVGPRERNGFSVIGQLRELDAIGNELPLYRGANNKLRHDQQYQFMTYASFQGSCLESSKVDNDAGLTPAPSTMTRSRGLFIQHKLRSQPEIWLPSMA
jgi:hypothetical protein